MLLNVPPHAMAPAPFVPSAPSRRQGILAGAGFAAAALFLLALLLRAPSFLASVLDPDEGLYLVQAREWLRGGWPYVAVWDMHPVGAPGLIAIALALVGDPLLALRLLGVVAVAATGTLLRTMVIVAGAGGPAVGFVAGALYVAHSLLLGGLATNTEILFAPFCAAGVTLAVAEALRLLQRGLPPRSMVVGGMGLLFGMALWVKQVAALEASMAFLGLIGLAWWRGALPAPRVILMALLFAAGCALPTMATAAIYAVRGELGPYLDGMVHAPLRYGGEILGAPGPIRGPAAAILALIWLFLAATPVLAAARRLRSAELALLPAAMVLWFAATSLQVAAPWKFFDHYFLMWLPPLSVLAALGLAEIARQMARRSRRGLVLGGMAAIMVALPALDFMQPRVAHGLGWRVADPPRQIAQAIKAELPAGEAVHVVNYHPIVYALAGVTPVTRFAFSEHLSGYFSDLIGVDANAELARVLASRPWFLVVAPGRWDRIRPEARSAVEAALAEAYTLVKVVPDGDGPVQLWRRR